MTAPPLDVDVGALGRLTLIGSGGQGRVFELPDHPERAVYKEYSPRVVDDLDVDALYRFVSFARDLPEAEQAALLERAAWPEQVVRRDGVVRGFLMRRVPEAYWTPLRFDEEVTTELALAQFLLNPPSYLTDRGLPTDAPFRLKFLRDAALTLALFHKLGIAVGDMSPNNMLFSRTHRPHCFFLDCDAMRLDGESVLAQAETVDWQVTGEELATPASDTFKLGLLAVLLFAADQQASNPRVVPQRLRRWTLASLAEDPATREPVLALLRPLERELREAGKRAARAAVTPTVVLPPQPEPEPEQVRMVHLTPPQRTPARRPARTGGGIGRWVAVVGAVAGIAFGCLNGNDSRTPTGARYTPPAGSDYGYTAPPYATPPYTAVPGYTLPAPRLTFPSGFPYGLPSFTFSLTPEPICPVVAPAPGVRGGAGLTRATGAVDELVCALNRDDGVLPSGAAALRPADSYYGVQITGFFGEGTAAPRATVQLREDGRCVQATVRFTAAYRISSVAGRAACG